MDINAFARAEMGAHGSKAVFHDGIWWQRSRWPSYSWPLNSLKAFPRGKARPPFLSRLVGYWHVVATEAEANTQMGMFLFRDIASYDLCRLSGNKRSHIRRGLERLEIRKMNNVRDLLEQGVDINRSALLRRGSAPSTDSLWFVNETLWRQKIERMHEFGARESWGAYCKGELVAWLQATDVEGIVNITSAMSHSAYLSNYPNDALLHTFLTDCKARPGITHVFFGAQVGRLGLYEFKQKLGFEPVQLPVFRWLSPGVPTVLNLRARYHDRN